MYHINLVNNYKQKKKPFWSKSVYSRLYLKKRTEKTKASLRLQYSEAIESKLKKAA